MICATGSGGPWSVRRRPARRERRRAEVGQVAGPRHCRGGHCGDGHCGGGHCGGGHRGGVDLVVIESRLAGPRIGHDEDPGDPVVVLGASLGTRVGRRQRVGEQFDLDGGHPVQVRGAELAGLLGPGADPGQQARLERGGAAVRAETVDPPRQRDQRPTLGGLENRAVVVPHQLVGDQRGVEQATLGAPEPGQGQFLPPGERLDRGRAGPEPSVTAPVARSMQNGRRCPSTCTTHAAASTVALWGSGGLILRGRGSPRRCRRPRRAPG